MYKRNTDGTFAKGNKGGPGRPAGPTLRPLLRDILAEADASGLTLEERILRELTAIALDAGQSAHYRLRAMELVFKAAEWQTVGGAAADGYINEPIQIFNFEPAVEPAEVG